MIELKGKRALVTGGSRGIGAAIALALANQGADVAITYNKSPERAGAVVSSIQALGRQALAIQADSANAQAAADAVAATVAALGGLDILVNNSAVGMNGLVADLDMGAFQHLLEVNVRAPVAFAKAAIPQLSKGGRIISIGSGLGDRVPFAGSTAYAMSKSALHSFTRGLARELGPHGITVNLISPGSTETESNPADGASAEIQRALTAIGRFVEPREIADVVAFIARPRADMITGTTIPVDGGAMA